ncbi:MAG TPA: polysaccharide deacetylase family protein [Candidatus Saccharimonadales bacterium]|nr:polysaccharide deacetylase family protein [Candidatus Saccharimonadales bacterium]
MITTLLLILFLLVVAAIIWLFFNPKSKIYSFHESSVGDKKIALTFDDGPNPASTPKILEILKSSSIKATFFVVGKNVRKYPDLLKKTANDGHLIANHGDVHKLALALSRQASLSDIRRTTESITKIINQKPTFYRPPYGFRVPWVAKAIDRAGYKIVTWNNMTYDYWGLASEKIVKNILNQSKPGGIIVLHDGHEGLAKSDFSQMLDALPTIITSLKHQGYKFVRIDELIGNP